MGAASGTVTSPPPMPRWFWLLPALAAAAWWPLWPYWKSDDFIAMHHAMDLGRALRDFVGPHYGATDLWFFYRPLVTLTEWFDVAIGGGAPWFAHTTNVLSHGASALLVALLWRRFLPDGKAFAAALLWAFMPSHQAALLWVAGRTDSRATFFCLLCLWLSLRQLESADAGGRARRWPALLALAAALASKEIAFAVPPLAALLAFLRVAGPLGQRVRAAALASAPLFVLFGAYLVFRWFVLGRLGGGYAPQQYEVLPALQGLGVTLCDLVVPLRWSGCEALPAGAVRDIVPWFAAAPLLLAAVWLARQPRFLGALVVFVVAAAPLLSFMADVQNKLNLRYYYLPAVALAGLLALPGRTVAALVLVAWCWPLITIRAAVVASDRESASMHTAMKNAADGGAVAPMFVAGLPIVNAARTSLQFHYGVDRVLEPPFHSPGRRVLALRPIVDSPGVFRLGPDGDEPPALPGGSTWWFRTPETLAHSVTASPWPDLPIAGDDGGVLDLTSPRLAAMQARQARIVLTTPGIRPRFFRLTIFTAMGYFCCLLPDHGTDNDANGTIDLLQFFAGDRAVGVDPAQTRIPPAQFAPGSYVMEGLEVPTTHDLVPEFPVLLEAGNLDGASFAPTHRAQRLLTFRFDRGYPAWKRRALGLDH